MAKLGENRYYKRNGDSFRQLEHFDIADMFGRRPHPKLKLEPRIERNQNGDLRIRLVIVNQGKSTAKAPFLAFNTNSSMEIYRAGINTSVGTIGNNEGLELLRNSPSGYSYAYGSKSDIVIHPGMRLYVTSLGNYNPLEREFPNEEIFIEYELASENQELIIDKIIFEKS